MIKNKWYIILESKEVKKGKITKVKRLGMDLILWRDSKNQVHAIESKCPHRGADLGLGKIIDDCVQCPYHGFEFNGEGKAVYIPSLGKNAIISENYRAKAFKIREFMNFIFLWYGEDTEDNINWLEGIDESYSYSTIKSEWNVNYTRAIENQLDVSHLPFVHHNTIGKGNRKLVNGPLVELNGDILNVWVCNDVDKGQKPKKQNEIKKDDCRGRLQFIFPNYWQNIINENFRIMAAFVPIDDENTTIYVRIYQKFLKLPILNKVFNKMIMQFNKFVLNQDKRVVISQIPKYSDLSNKDYLVPADQPILMYRKYLNDHKNN